MERTGQVVKEPSRISWRRQGAAVALAAVAAFEGNQAAPIKPSCSDFLRAPEDLDFACVVSACFDKNDPNNPLLGEVKGVYATQGSEMRLYLDHPNCAVSDCVRLDSRTTLQDIKLELDDQLSQPCVVNPQQNPAAEPDADPAGPAAEPANVQPHPEAEPEAEQPQPEPGPDADLAEAESTLAQLWNIVEKTVISVVFLGGIYKGAGWLYRKCCRKEDPQAPVIAQVVQPAAIGYVVRNTADTDRFLQSDTERSDRSSESSRQLRQRTRSTSAEGRREQP